MHEIRTICLKLLKCVIEKHRTCNCCIHYAHCTMHKHIHHVLTIYRNFDYTLSINLSLYWTCKTNQYIQFRILCSTLDLVWYGLVSGIQSKLHLLQSFAFIHRSQQMYIASRLASFSFVKTRYFQPNLTFFSNEFAQISFILQNKRWKMMKIWCLKRVHIAKKIIVQFYTTDFSWSFLFTFVYFLSIW